MRSMFKNFESVNQPRSNEIDCVVGRVLNIHLFSNYYHFPMGNGALKVVIMLRFKEDTIAVHVNNGLHL